MKPSLTKRVLLRAIQKATRKLSSEAMTLEGFIVQAENGWVIRTDGLGKCERLSRIVRARNRQIILD